MAHPSCLREEEEGGAGYFCQFVDANRGLQSTSPELEGGDRDAVTKREGRDRTLKGGVASPFQ